MKNIVISTGAGISAESGISTFRDAGGLWEQYPVMDVASAEGFARNPQLVHRFYNERRHQLVNAQPNDAHRILADLQNRHNVTVITQNVDNLHERAGQQNVVHLHGELMKVRAIDNENLLYTLPDDNNGSLDTTPDTLIHGHRVRPHIVFFGEAVPEMDRAAQLAADADMFVVIGTSLAVYPAASLLYYVRRGVPVYYIDPRPAAVPDGVAVIADTASAGLRRLVDDTRI